MKVLGGVLVVLLLLTIPFPAEAVVGTIQGRVINRTGGARPMANISVTLTQYVNETEDQKVTATTDAAGHFSFKGLSTDPSRSYVVGLQYKGGQYESPRLSFKGNGGIKTVEMAVYEPTEDPSTIRAGMHHLIVEVREGALWVAELVVFTNTTDRTYIGNKPLPDGRRETLRFTLPKGAKEVRYLEGLMECCVIATEGSLVDTMDVKPGTRQIAYSYILPFGTSRLSIDRPLDIPTDTLEFLVADAGVTVRSEQLKDRGVLETSAGRYLRYSGTKLGKGDRVSVLLEGLPTKTRSFRALAFALALAILSAVLTYPLLRRRHKGQKASVGAAGRSPLPEERRLALIKEIADLDDRFEAGQLSEEDYRTLRAQRKAELVELSRQMHNVVVHNSPKEGKQ